MGHLLDNLNHDFSLSNRNSSPPPNIYRLITANLLLLVNCDKIMHMHLDFDTSNAQTRRVSAWDKH